MTPRNYKSPPDATPMPGGGSVHYPHRQNLVWAWLKENVGFAVLVPIAGGLFWLGSLHGQVGMMAKTSDLASKDDLAELEGSTKEQFAKLEGSTKEQFAKLEGSIGIVNGKLDLLLGLVSKSPKRCWPNPRLEGKARTRTNRK